MTETIDEAVIRRLVNQGAVEQVMKIIEEKDAKIARIKVAVDEVVKEFMAYQLQMNEAGDMIKEAINIYKD